MAATEEQTAEQEATIGFLVDLEPDLHGRLQDEAIRRSRADGKRVPMTQVARELFDRHLPRGQ